MPSKTAKAVNKTLIEGLSYLIEYFKYISREDVLKEILVKTLNDRLVEAFLVIYQKRSMVTILPT